MKHAVSLFIGVAAGLFLCGIPQACFACDRGAYVRSYSYATYAAPTYYAAPSYSYSYPAVATYSAAVLVVPVAQVGYALPAATAAVTATAAKAEAAPAPCMKEVEALKLQLEAMKLAIGMVQTQQGGRPAMPAAVAPAAPAPPPPPVMPKVNGVPQATGKATDGDAILAKGIARLNTACASCHTGATARGPTVNGVKEQIVLFTAPGQPNPDADLIRAWGEIAANRMPVDQTGAAHPLDDKEASEVWAMVLEINRRNRAAAQQPAPKG